MITEWFGTTKFFTLAQTFKEYVKHVDSFKKKETKYALDK